MTRLVYRSFAKNLREIPHFGEAKSMNGRFLSTNGEKSSVNEKSNLLHLKVWK